MKKDKKIKILEGIGLFAFINAGLFSAWGLMIASSAIAVSCIAVSHRKKACKDK